MSINDGKIIRTRHPWLAKLTGHPRRQVIATIVTRPARTDTHGRDVSDTPGLWDESDITATTPHRPENL
jgi:hypothetical protein